MASRGRAWPLYAVIGGAALVGSIAMVLVMRSGAAAKVTEPAIASRGAPPPGRPASQITVVPIIEAPPADHAAALAAAAQTSAASAPVTAAPTAAAAAKRDSAVAAGATAKSPGAARGIRTPAPPRIQPAPAAVVTGREPSDEIARAFAAAKYDKVVAQCSGRPVTAEHAPPCVLAACHVGNEAAARKLIVAAPAARRERLIASCKDLGVDLGVGPGADKALAKPLDDCEADPMACQH
jgi:hypothetical protein